MIKELTQRQGYDNVWNINSLWPNLNKVALSVCPLGLGPAETSNARAAFPAWGLLGDPRHGPPAVSQEDVALGYWSIGASIANRCLKDSNPSRKTGNPKSITDTKNCHSVLFEACKVRGPIQLGSVNDTEERKWCNEIEQWGLVNSPKMPDQSCD